MRWAAIVLAAVLVLAAGMGSAQTPSSAPPVKLALVIGNADYDGGGIDVTPQGVAESTAGGYVPDLRNPINDATDIRDALTRIGFKVDFVTDADGPTMSAALATFGTKVAEAPDSAQVVIYYAGHAMQVDGVNYLIPARARLPQVDFSRMPSRNAYGLIESVTVPIQRVVDQFREPRAPGVNLLILDACRDNPWDSRVRGLTRNTSPNAGGLAQVAAPTRTIVSFSTALNRKAQDGGENDRNSPFAAALKDAIGKPGTIAEMLDGVGTTVEAATFGRQSPWYQSASVGRVCLARCVSPAAAGPLVEARSEGAEELAWRGALSANSVAAFESFLEQYPSGAYAKIAQQNVARLSGAGQFPDGVARTNFCDLIAQIDKPSEWIEQRMVSRDNRRWLMQGASAKTQRAYAPGLMQLPEGNCSAGFFFGWSYSCTWSTAGLGQAWFDGFAQQVNRCVSGTMTSQRGAFSSIPFLGLQGTGNVEFQSSEYVWDMTARNGRFSLYYFKDKATLFFQPN